MPTKAVTEDWHKWFVCAVIFTLFVGLTMSFKTPETLAFIAVLALWNVGVISADDATQGFSNGGMLTVGVLFVVIQAVERSQIAGRLARFVFGAQTGVRTGLLRLCLFCFAISAFLNNTPIVALLTPITRDWARARGFSPSTFLIPLSFSTILGGLLTIVGTSTNLVVLGLAQDAGLQGLGFFEIAYVSLPAGLVGIVYLVLVGPMILPKSTGLFRYMTNRGNDLITEVEVMSDFKHKDKSVREVLAVLEFHVDVLVKIRRPTTPPVAPQDVEISNDAHSVEDDRTIAQQAPASAQTNTASSFSNSRGDLVRRGRRSGQENRDDEDGRHDDGVVLQPMLPNGNLEERGYTDIFPVLPNEIIHEGDILFMSGGRNTIMQLHKGAVTSKGLKVLGGGSDELAGVGMEFVEVVLSNRNAFVGDVLSQTSFGQHYGCSILALRRKGRVIPEAVASIRSVESHGQLASATQRHNSQVLTSPRIGPLTQEGGLRMSMESIASGLHISRSSREVQVVVEGSDDREGSQRMGMRSLADAAEHEMAGPGEEGGVVDVEYSKNMEVSISTLQAGDAVLLLAPETFYEKFKDAHDFLLVQTVGKTPDRVRLFDYAPCLFFIAMITLVACDVLDMLQASMVTAGVLILGGWIDSKKAVGYVPWDLMLLIGSMLGVSRSITQSGLAELIGQAIKESGMGPMQVLYLIFGVTTLATEIVTNNAAAGLIFPIAVSIAQKYQVSYKPFMVVVMCAASASFITPIGYQTNMMVWAPGGYKFSDFTKIGLPINIVYLISVCLLAPVVWPFDDANFIIPQANATKAG